MCVRANGGWGCSLCKTMAKPHQRKQKLCKRRQQHMSLYNFIIHIIESNVSNDNKFSLGYFRTNERTPYTVQSNKKKILQHFIRLSQLLCGLGVLRVYHDCIWVLCNNGIVSLLPSCHAINGSGEWHAVSLLRHKYMERIVSSVRLSI